MAKPKQSLTDDDAESLLHDVMQRVVAARLLNPSPEAHEALTTAFAGLYIATMKFEAARNQTEPPPSPLPQP